MTFGINFNLTQLIFCGFGLSFGLWVITRGMRLIFEILSSRHGNIKPD